MVASWYGKFGPVRSGGWGTLAPPNNLLKFDDFVNEKDCEGQGHGNEDSNSYLFEEVPESIKAAMNFGVLQLKIICSLVKLVTFNQNFPGKIPINEDSLRLSVADFPKIGRFPTF